MMRRRITSVARTYEPSLRSYFAFKRLLGSSPSIDFARATLREVSTALQTQEVSAEDLTAWSLDRCDVAHDRLNCLAGSAEDRAEWRHRAEKAAAEAGDRIRAGTPLSALDGIPLTVKDNFCVEGMATSACSKVLGSWRPPFSAASVESLEAAGAVLTGKTNQDEFGMGSATAYSRYGPVASPWSYQRATHLEIRGNDVESQAAGGAAATGADGRHLDSGDPAEEAAGPAPPSPPTFVAAAGSLSAGGSSGGAASLVASGASFGALASDTGGSVRQPAAWCGVVGLKPSFGRVSRHGLIAYASSMDCPSLITRSCEDAALLLDSGLLAGDRLSTPNRPQQRDAHHVTAASTATTPNWSGHTLESSPAYPLAGLVVGVPHEFHVAELHASNFEAWAKCVDTLQGLGAKVVGVSLPSVPFALPAYYVLACAEAHSNLARFDGLRYGDPSTPPTEEGGESKELNLKEAITRARSMGFGDEVQRRILCGAYVLCASSYGQYYEQAAKLRHRLRTDFDRAFAGLPPQPQQQQQRGPLSGAGSGSGSSGGFSTEAVDVMVTPTAPLPPAFLSSLAASSTSSSPSSPSPTDLYLNDVMTVPANLAGIPALSLPVATTTIPYPFPLEGGSPNAKIEVPVGMQLMAKHMDEATLLRVGVALERAVGFQLPAHVTSASAK